MPPGEVRWTWWARAHVSTCDAEIRRLRARLDERREQSRRAFAFWLEPTK